MTRVTPGQFDVHEIRALWRALTLLPRDDVSEEGAIAAFVRAELPPVAAQGLQRLGRYDSAGRQVVLYNGAFGWELTRISLTEVVAQLVGQSAWRRYRMAVDIDDAAEFGALYASYYLEPEALERDRPALWTRLDAALPARPSRDSFIAAADQVLAGATPVQAAEWTGPELGIEPPAIDEARAETRALAAVRAWLCERHGPASDEAFTLALATDLEDLAATAPLVFVHAWRRPEASPDRLPLAYVLAYDADEDAVSFQDLNAFASLARARGRGLRALDPALCARMAHAAARGVLPRVVLGAIVDRPHVRLPEMYALADGGTLIRVWIHGGRDRRFWRHSTEVASDGSTTTWIEQERDLVI